MRRPSAPVPAAARLRRYLFPALALVISLVLMERKPWQSGFDAGALRSLLSAGRVDAALSSLAQAPQGALLPELAGVNWWPAEARSRRLASLEADVASLPSAPGPELLLPAGRLREAPRGARLSRPAEGPLRLELHASALGLEAAQVEIEAGQLDVPLGAPVLIGTSYDVVLTRPDGALLSILHFEVLPSASARDVGVVMASAHELGGGGAPGELLAAIVCLHFGLYQEALTRLDTLMDDPALGPVARELSAVALSRLSRPAEAMALLGPG
ncbi:MAG: hypothetical protein DRQ55_00895 [Planctomycetota bacterium]|nr:MAG: hypothetical protein DRQ55_00895 [Planctomycetota bacterium]